MPRLLAAMCLFIAFLNVQAAPVPKHLMPKDEPYWPTELGTKWVYDQRGQERALEITKSDTRAGVTSLTIGGAWNETVDVSRDGVTERTCEQFTMNTLIVRFPLKAGDSWEVAHPIQPGLQAQSGLMTVGDTEAVTVPAGKFMATKVVFTVTATNGNPIAKPTTYTFWYAQRVGLVRLEFDGGERVLKSFTPGKK